MRYSTSAINKLKPMRLTILPILLLMVVGCSSQANHSKIWPVNLNVIELSDGGICLDADSARRLAEFKADLEAI